MSRRYAIAGAIALAVVAVDLLTKRWASATYTATPVDIWGEFLQFRYVENPGGAFALFPQGGPVLGVAAIGAIVFVAWLLRQDRPMWETVGLGLVLAGAAGNLTDRIARGPGFLDGAVIDWVNLWFIPTFNVADAAITVAVVVLLAGSFFAPTAGEDE